jgi:hypothetical protein
MGTNYYLHFKVCPHCNKPAEILHIGKSSAGWCFALHVNPEGGINDLADWIQKFNADGSKILNEYDDELGVGDMLQIITERSWNGTIVHSDSWYAQNHAQLGPHGLSRHAIDGRHCIGHGFGTYDYITGEFS